jgi:hypothetical protein
MRKSVGQAPTAGEQTQQKPCWTRSDVGSERFNDVKQREIHTAEPLVPEPSAFEFYITIGKLNRHMTRY